MSVVGVKRHPLIIPPPPGFGGWAGQRLRAINPENRGSSDTKEVPGASWMDSDTITYGALLYIDRGYETQTDYDAYIIADRGGTANLAFAAFDWNGSEGWSTNWFRNRATTFGSIDGSDSDLPIFQWFFLFVVDNGDGNLANRYIGFPGAVTTEPSYGGRVAGVGSVASAGNWSIGSRANGSGGSWLGGMAWVCAWPAALTQAQCDEISTHWRMPHDLKPAMELFPGMHTGSIIDVTGHQHSAITNFSAVEMARPSIAPPVTFATVDELMGGPPAASAFTQSVAGTVTPTGTVATVLGVVLALAGTITPAGTVDLGPGITPAATVTPTGTINTVAGVQVAGTVTPTGTVSSVAGFQQAVAGTVTPAGTVGLAVEFDSLRATIIPTGALVTLSSSFAQAVAGSITPAGTVGVGVGNSLAGVVTPAGTVSSVAGFQQAVAGAVTPVGTVARAVAISLASTTTPAGTLTTIPTGASQQSVAGTVTPVGTIAVGPQIDQAGLVTPAGVLSVGPQIGQVGVVTPAGDILVGVAVALTGTVTAAGVLTSPSFPADVGVTAQDRTHTRYAVRDLTEPRYDVEDLTGPRYWVRRIQ